MILDSLSQVAIATDSKNLHQLQEHNPEVIQSAALQRPKLNNPPIGSTLFADFAE